MYKFNELIYERPDYEKEQKALINYRYEIMSASSYEEIRRGSLSIFHNLWQPQIKRYNIKQ